MNNHYTQPKRLTFAFYRFLYDPFRARYLDGLVQSLGLAGSEHVLDFGSGAGSEARYLARALTQGGHVTCLDVSPAWLEEARSRLRSFDNVSFVSGDVRTLDLPAASVDIVFAHYVLHDVDRSALPAVLRALARVLRPGGRFEVIEPASPRHGLPAAALGALLSEAGLVDERQAGLDRAIGDGIRLTFRAPGEHTPRGTGDVHEWRCIR